MGFAQQFKSLPVSTKRLLGIGAIFAFVIALPLFIWSVVNMRFDVREKATVCTPRPACLDAKPHPCEILEPEEGWCPATTPTASPSPTICASVPMTLTVIPTESSGGLGNTKRFEVSVTNNDDASCGSTHTVNLTASVPTHEGNTYPGWTINFTNESFVIAAHETYSTYVDVKSPTSDYAFGRYSITINLTSVNIPQNATSQTFFYNLLGTPTPSPTPTPTPGPEIGGIPNYCGGTCGSKYNCQANYLCYQGYCRNPLCPSDSNCDCITPTPKPAPIKTKTPTPKPSPTMEIVYLSPQPSISPSQTPTSTPTILPFIAEAKSSNLNFLLYIAGGSLLIAILLLIINSMKQKKGFAPLALILVLALPVFVWAIATGNFNVSEKAAGRKPTPIPSPTPSNKVNWTTQWAMFSATNFEIQVPDGTTDGKTFRANPSKPCNTKTGAMICVTSNPPNWHDYQNLHYMTLEVQWYEYDIEMRMFIYLYSDGKRWWSNEIRVYNGQPAPDSEWVYYYGKFFDLPVGQPFTQSEQFVLNAPDPKTGGPVSLRFSNVKFYAFLNYFASPKPKPIRSPIGTPVKDF